MRLRYYFRSLFVLIALSIAITEARHGFGQVIFIFFAYVICYFLNRLLIRSDLLSNLHRQDGPKKSFFFRGENYDAMEDVDREKRFLATTGATTRVNFTRWLTRGMFAAFVFALYSSQKDGKLVSTPQSLFHLLIASTFLPMESLSHTLLPLGFNAILVTFFIAYNRGSGSLLLAMYFAALFVTLGLYGFSFLSKQFSTNENLNLRVKSSLNLLAVWAVMAAILYAILPGESIKELIREPVKKLEGAVEEQIDKHVMPALQKAADSQLPNFDQIDKQISGEPARPTMPSQEELKAAQQKLEQVMARGGLQNLKVNPSDIKGGAGKGGSGPLSGGGNAGIGQANAAAEFERAKKIFEDFQKLPPQQQEANARQVLEAEERLKQLEELSEKLNKGRENDEVEQLADRPKPDVPSVEQIKALQEQISEAKRRGDLKDSDLKAPDIQAGNANEEFEKIKKQLEKVDIADGLPLDPQGAQSADLEQLRKNLEQIDKIVKENPSGADSSATATPSASASATANASATATNPPTPTPLPNPTPTKIFEPPKPPKFDLPDLDRFWPFLKLLGLLAIAWALFSILNPYFQKNDERKAKERKLTKKDKAKLRAFLKHTQEMEFKDARDEVIKKYHAFLEIMEFIQRPRHESLPAEDFGEFLKQDLRRNLLELDSLTWGFSDVLYGETQLDEQRLNTFRKSFNEMARSFLNIS